MIHGFKTGLLHLLETYFSIFFLDCNEFPMLSTHGLYDFYIHFLSMSHFSSCFTEYKINVSVNWYYFIFTFPFQCSKYNKE